MFSCVLFYVLKVSYILFGITVCVFQCVSCYMYDCVCKLSIGAMLYSLLLLLLLLLMSSYLQDCFAIFHDDFCILVIFSSFSVSFCNLDVCIYLFFYVLLTTEVLIIYITEIVCSTMQRNKKKCSLIIFSLFIHLLLSLFFCFPFFTFWLINVIYIHIKNTTNIINIHIDYIQTNFSLPFFRFFYYSIQSYLFFFFFFFLIRCIFFLSLARPIILCVRNNAVFLFLCRVMLGSSLEIIPLFYAALLGH